MELSVIIVSYNTKELLDDCLKSVKAATVKIESEVFVVDNESQDDSVQMVKQNFPWVKVIANDKNVGFARANNQAIKKAKGEYLLILNPDTKVLPETLVIMLDFMNHNKEVGVATCRVEFPNGKLDVDCRRHFPTPWRAFCHFSGLSRMFKGSKLFDQYNYGYQAEDKQLEIDACVGAFMMIPKKAIAKVGMLDEEFFFYGEDLDWCYRFKEHGYKIMYTPITKVIHYKGASSGIKKTSQQVTKATSETKRMVKQQSIRAMRIFYRKHYKNKHSFLINWPVYFGMWVLEKYRVSKV